MPPFPFDLIEEVLAYCADTTLVSCALTSRDVLELSRRLLYKSLWVSQGIVYEAPADIATTYPHLLRYTRHLYINASGDNTGDVIILVQRLVHYGNLAAIWFSFKTSPPIFKFESGPPYIPYLPHFVPLLQMESVKYVHAPVITPPLESPYEGIAPYMQALLLSNASLELAFRIGDMTTNCSFDYLTLISSKSSVTTLSIDFHPCDPYQSYHKSWNWFTSHISLSHLQRLSIRIVFQERGFMEKFSSSLPESLSELSIFYLIPDSFGIETVSSFQIERFHSLRNLSLFIPVHPVYTDDCYATVTIQLLERISPSSRRSLNKIYIYANLRAQTTTTRFINDAKWKTVGEVIATFPSTLDTTFSIDPLNLEESTVRNLVNICRSGLPRVHVEIPSESLRLSARSDSSGELFEPCVLPMFPDSKGGKYYTDRAFRWVGPN